MILIHYPENKSLFSIDAVKYLWNSFKFTKRQHSELTVRDKLAIVAGLFQIIVYPILILVVAASVIG